MAEPYERFIIVLRDEDYWSLLPDSVAEGDARIASVAKCEGEWYIVFSDSPDRHKIPGEYYGT